MYSQRNAIIPFHASISNQIIIAMNIKERTGIELEKRIKKLEGLIAEKGVGSSYRRRVDRIQRDVNLALILGASSAILGLGVWAILKSRKD